MHLNLFLQGVALVGGTVHTMTEGTEPSVQTVLIEEGRITAIAEDLELPEGTEIVDVAGMHVAPGLIDGMTNHDADHDALYIASGVTLIRDTGNDLSMFEQGFLGIVVGNALPELAELDSPRVFHAREHFAAGVGEGLRHWFQRVENGQHTRS